MQRTLHFLLQYPLYISRLFHSDSKSAKVASKSFSERQSSKTPKRILPPFRLFLSAIDTLKNCGAIDRLHSQGSELLFCVFQQVAFTTQMDASHLKGRLCAKTLYKWCLSVCAPCFDSFHSRMLPYLPGQILVVGSFPEPECMLITNLRYDTVLEYFNSNSALTR